MLYHHKSLSTVSHRFCTLYDCDKTFAHLVYSLQPPCHVLPLVKILAQAEKPLKYLAGFLCGVYKLIKSLQRGYIHVEEFRGYTISTIGYILFPFLLMSHVG